MTKENITERVRGGGVSTAPKININIPKVGSGGSGGRNNPSTTTKTPIRKISPQQFDNRSARVTTNTPSGGSLKAGSFGISQAGRDQAAKNRAEFNKPQPAATTSSNTSSNTSSSSMSTRDKFKSKFIKKDKGVGFVKRGTPGAQRAENIERNRMRARQMAKDNAARKQEAEVKSKSQSNSGGSSQTMTASYKPDMDAYDMVLEYLMSTEQAATIEEANYVMMQLDEENIQEIVGAAVKGLKMVGRFGAKSPLHLAATLGTTAALAPSVGKGLYKAKETVGNVVNKITNFDPIGDARKKKIGDKQKEYRQKSGTTKDDGYFYDPTIDKKG